MDRRALIWLAVVAAAGVALALLYPDSYQQDGGYHYLFARVAWEHPEILVGVWSRPLFTLIYSFPAQFGYLAAKLFTVLICVATAHQTWRFANELKLDRAALVIPLMFLQPTYSLIAADTMTEPIFALVFVVAARLHVKGRVAAGAFVASLMILARPEGFFLAVLWAVWLLRDRRDPGVWTRIARVPLLGCGAALWWLSAWWLTGDPLYIKHNWPAGWEVTSAAHGIGNIWVYWHQLPEIVGPLLSVVFLLGLAVSLVRRRIGTMTSAFLTLFVLHSVLRAFGLFGSAGYSRYFVCVSPAIALITLAGWNDVAGWLGRVPRVARVTVGTAVLALSAVVTAFYVDAAAYSRDARAVAEMHAWFRANERPVDRLIWSQAYMCILMDCDVWEKPAFSGDKADNLDLVRRSPGGTLVFWDGDTGPSWYGITADDLADAGYERLRSQTYALSGLIGIKGRWWFHDWGPRPQEMHLFYKARSEDK